VTASQTQFRRLLTAAEAEAQVAQRAARVDRVVCAAFENALAPQFPSGVAALAVGGFGRGELFPYSDVDVLLLTRDGLEPHELKGPVGSFVQALWDAGMRLSHSVRTVGDCCQMHDGNTELSISLLDRRLLAGDAALFKQLEERIPKFFRLQGRALARHLARLTRERHGKFQNTIYHLEPNIKETPGGIRDLHVVHWLTRLQDGSPPPELAEARAFLFPLRSYLHERSKRDDNILGFDAQEEISGQPAEMMRSYYRHARAVSRAAGDLVDRAEEAGNSLLGQFRDWRSRLSNNDFTVSRERILLRSPARLGHDPQLIWRLFEFMARHGVPISHDTERRVREALPGLFVSGQPLWPALSSVLSQPKASFALRAMEETGVLPAIIPEWSRIECLVVRDFYHRYTVDEHTILAVASLEHLEGDHRFRSLLAEVDQPALLRLALLLHDIGKGVGEHVERGMALARGVSARLGLSPGETSTLLFLIEQHLVLSSVMTSRDLDDPATGRSLANAIGTVERLKMLTLLTYCDINAVNPTALTPWRREQLWRTYVLAYEELTRELETERIHSPEVSDAAMAGFLEGFPKRYLRTHTESEMQSHFALWSQARDAGVAVEVAKQAGFYRLTVATPDRPFLFSSISGALASFGLNILKAEAFANRAHFVLDTFTFSDPLRNLELNPTEFDRLRDTISRVVMGKEDVVRLLRNRARPARRPQTVVPSVAFNNDASPAATLIEIVSEDRPGLLYDLTSAMSQAGCNIEVVLIDTEGQRALDVFYVTASGKKLNPSDQAPLRSSLLDACTA
jgi:[protein-PII] uridylyltransferase